MLDLINKVQMFQIAGSQVNRSLITKRKNPVFDLQFTEAFNQSPSEKQSYQSQIIVNNNNNIDRKQLLHAPSSMMDLQENPSVMIRETELANE